MFRMLGATFAFAMLAETAAALSLVQMRVHKEVMDTGFFEEQFKASAIDAKSAGRSGRRWQAMPHAVWNHTGSQHTVPVLTSDYGLDHVNWSLCNVSYHSNLGGLGPDDGEESIRFYNITTAGGGHGIDLAITAEGLYRAKNPDVNGLVSGDSCFGVINLKAHFSGYSEVPLLFSYYISGTNTSVALDKDYLTFFDFDTGSSSAEQVTFYHRVNNLYAVPDHDMNITGSIYNSVGCRFEALARGTGSDNPKDPSNLTAEQKRRAVMVDYINQSQFQIKLGIDGGKGGRNFVFAGKTDLPLLNCSSCFDTTTTTTTTTGTTTITTTTSTKSATTSTTDGNRGKSTTTTTTCLTQSCQVWADPHVSGFDNLENQGPAYLFLLQGQGHASEKHNHSGLYNGRQTLRTRMRTFDKRPIDVEELEVGDFWLVKSEHVFVQARFSLSGEFIPDRAAIGAVAVGGPFIQNRTIVVEPINGQVALDGLLIPGGQWSSRDGSIRVHQQAYDQVDLHLPMGVHLLFKRFPKHIDVKISMPPIPGMDGECGNFDGDAENDDDVSLRERMGKITVDDSVRLFDTKFEPNTQAMLAERSMSSSGIGEADYQAVASMRDDAAMAMFVKRVLASENKVVKPEAEEELHGFVPWFSGTKTIQSLQQMKQELSTQAWVQDAPLPQEVAAQHTPNDASLQKLLQTNFTPSRDAAQDERPHAVPVRQDPAPSAASAAADGNFTCSECLVWGSSHVLSFSAFRKFAAQHPMQRTLLRSQGWLKEKQMISESGTFLLVKTSSVNIQGRFWRIASRPGIVNLGALAVGGDFLEGNKLIIRYGEVMWNKQKILRAEASNFSNRFVSVESSPHTGSSFDEKLLKGVQFRFHNGMSMLVAQHHHMLDATITMCSSLVGDGTIEGQCGSFEAGQHAEEETRAAKQKASLKLFQNAIIFPDGAPSPVVGDNVRVREDDRSAWLFGNVSNVAPLKEELDHYDEDLEWPTIERVGETSPLGEV